MSRFVGYFVKQILSFFVICFLSTPWLLASDFVGRLKNSNGSVDIIRSERIHATTSGSIVKDGDMIVTAQGSKTTLLLRDGTEIRLFPNTHFKIIKIIESPSQDRLFLNTFRLQRGTIWGNFPHKKQISIIHTPTAQIKTSGALFKLNQTKKTLDVSLTKGDLAIENEYEAGLLSSGKMVKGITKNKAFLHNLKSIPYLLTITPQMTEMPSLSRVQERFFFVFQLIDKRTKERLQRPAYVYITMDRGKIQFPKIRLNGQGFARIPTKIFPSGQQKIRIYAIAEGRNFMDVALGETTLDLL